MSTESVYTRVNRAACVVALLGAVMVVVIGAAARAGDGAYSNPWVEGDIIVNMSAEPVYAARADSDGYESDPNSQSVAVTLFTKTSFFSGHVAMLDPNTPSDLFVTSPGENASAGTLYRISRDTFAATAINSSLNDSTDPELPDFNGGIASDGSFLYLYDAIGNIDRYNFDGTKDTDNLITGINSGGFTGTNQISHDGGFLFIATGTSEIQYAPTSGGAAATLNGAAGVELTGVWAGNGRLVTADSQTFDPVNNPDVNQVIAYDLDLSGDTPAVSGSVIEGIKNHPGGFLGGVSVDPIGNKIYAGSAGSFGSDIPGGVLQFDLDGDIEEHNDNDLLLDVISGLGNGGRVGAFFIPRSVLIGDLDCDGDVDFDDIDPFVLGLQAPDQYESTFGLPPSVKGDTDGDGDLDFDDIDGFVDILNSPGGLEARGVPEPSTLSLTALIGLVVFAMTLVMRRPAAAR